MVARLHMNHVILVIEVCSFVAGFFRCIQSNAQAHRTRKEVCNQRTYTFFLGGGNPSELIDSPFAILGP